MKKKSRLKEKRFVWRKMVEIERGVVMKKKGWLKEKRSVWTKRVGLKKRVFLKKKSWLKEKRSVWRKRVDLKRRRLYEEKELIQREEVRIRACNFFYTEGPRPLDLKAFEQLRQLRSILKRFFCDCFSRRIFPCRHRSFRKSWRILRQLGKKQKRQYPICSWNT